MTTPPIRILLVDDHEMVRAGFRIILGAQPGFEVVGEAADGAVAIERARDLRPDVICMDVQMPGMDGIEATALITADPAIEAHVLILTTFDDENHLFTALAAGASGFLLKNSSPEQLAEAVRTLASGDALLSPAVTRRVLERLGRNAAETVDPAEPRVLDILTEREHEVLVLLAVGRSNAEIAAELFLGEATVKTHVSKVLQKLALRDRVQAVVYAYEHGVVRPGAGA